MKKHSLFTAGALLALATTLAASALAQTTHPTVYLESRDEFSNDFSAGVIRKNVPVTLTEDRQQAGYVVRFTWATNEGSKTQGVMTALMTGIYMSGSYERVSMSITERRSKNVVYSYTCQKGGRHTQSVAECLAKHWKDAFEGRKIEMRQFSAIDLAGIEDTEDETISVRKAGDTLPAQVTAHPATSPAVVPETTPAFAAQTETVADASRRLKAAQAAEKAKPHS
jgi:hypothetical protein